LKGQSAAGVPGNGGSRSFLRNGDQNKGTPSRADNRVTELPSRVARLTGKL